MREVADDIATAEERRKETPLRFEEVVEDLKIRGRI